MKKRNLLILRRRVQLLLTKAVPVRPICRLEPSWVDYVRVISTIHSMISLLVEAPSTAAKYSGTSYFFVYH